MKLKKMTSAICMIAIIALGIASAADTDPEPQRVNTASYSYTKSTTNVSLAAIGRDAGTAGGTHYYYAKSVATKTTQGTAVESATVEEYHKTQGRKQIQNKKAVCSIGQAATSNEISRKVGNSSYYYRHQASNHNVTNANYATDANISDTTIMTIY